MATITPDVDGYPTAPSSAGSNPAGMATMRVTPPVDWSRLTPTEFARAHGITLDQVPAVAQQYGFTTFGSNSQGTRNAGPDSNPGSPFSPAWGGQQGGFAPDNSGMDPSSRQRLSEIQNAHAVAGDVNASHPRGYGNTIDSPYNADSSGLSGPQLRGVQDRGYFKTGGEFPVAGRGNADNKLVQFHATPGEMVIVVPKGQNPLDFIKGSLPHFALGDPGSYVAGPNNPNPSGLDPNLVNSIVNTQEQAQQETALQGAAQRAQIASEMSGYAPDANGNLQPTPTMRTQMESSIRDLGAAQAGDPSWTQRITRMSPGENNYWDQVANQYSYDPVTNAQAAPLSSMTPYRPGMGQWSPTSSMIPSDLALHKLYEGRMMAIQAQMLNPQQAVDAGLLVPGYNMHPGDPYYASPSLPPVNFAGHAMPGVAQAAGMGTSITPNYPAQTAADLNMGNNPAMVPGYHTPAPTLNLWGGPRVAIAGTALPTGTSAANMAAYQRGFNTSTGVVDTAQQRAAKNGVTPTASTVSRVDPNGDAWDESGNYLGRGYQ